MSVVYRLDKVPDDLAGRAVAVGVFDGVHWGHFAIFERLLEVSRANALTSTAMTFDRHPAELLAPTRAPLYISTLDQRIEQIHAAGIEEVVVAEFDHALADLDRETFLTGILSGRLKTRHVVVGSNFRFGKGRDGDIRYLAEAAPRLGMEVSAVPAVVVDGGPVSSTRIRELVGRGDVADAARLLGRRFALRGTVVMGRQVGRTLGFPTANIQTAPHQLVPARGVYVVEVTIGLSGYSGVCNVGVNPTFGAGPRTVEVHLAGFDGSLYGETLDIIFVRRLRDEMVFGNPRSPC